MVDSTIDLQPVIENERLIYLALPAWNPAPLVLVLLLMLLTVLWPGRRG